MSISAIFALMHAPFPAIYVELFPANISYIATAIAYNMSTAIFGGVTPLVCTWLVAYTGDHLAPLYWLSATGIVSVIAVITLPETKSQPQYSF
jgi:MFS transporter, MHS family, proline/betaine transporter